MTSLSAGSTAGSAILNDISLSPSREPAHYSVRHELMRTVRLMEVTFTAPVWFWKGSAPFHFVTVPEPECALIAAASELVTYGWGMVPVTVNLGSTTWTTSLWPKNGGYIVPLKDAVRRAEAVSLDDTGTLRLTVAV